MKRNLLGLVALAIFAGAEPYTPMPRFAGKTIPDPPRQRDPWTHPETTLPRFLITATAALFDSGMGVPRGCEYRDVEFGDWSLVKTRGFVLPERPGDSGRLLHGPEDRSPLGMMVARQSRRPVKRESPVPARLAPCHDRRVKARQAHEDEVGPDDPLAPRTDDDARHRRRRTLREHDPDQRRDEHLFVLDLMESDPPEPLISARSLDGTATSR